MDMQSATLWELIFSMARSLKILSLHPTTATYFTVPRSQVPRVNRTHYQLIDISEDGFVSYLYCSSNEVSLLTENGNTKDDLRLSTDDTLLTQIKDGFGEGKDLVVTVMSAMGEEQICALKDIGPKNRRPLQH
ncbi:hypothetical protein RHSIM_Rhsim03G0257000 [Rhododendron simsii]|uniref:Translation initiation factor 5A C-terminal domain-containing protein n=1 Tax=Rhododendron simsii TaxID=118357 RepID=A0A834HBV0_RHOSS|nr:hypothetical protein RHSIM_Rhsim03G0257000 [Rhododendron simsii]